MERKFTRLKKIFTVSGQRPQPTVLVKKPDGTYVRVSLAELKAQKKEDFSSAETVVPAPPAATPLEPTTVPVASLPSDLTVVQESIVPVSQPEIISSAVEPLPIISETLPPLSSSIAPVEEPPKEIVTAPAPLAASPQSPPVIDASVVSTDVEITPIVEPVSSAPLAIQPNVSVDVTPLVTAPKSDVSLHEDFPSRVINSGAPRVSTKRLDEVAGIIEKISFKVPKDYENRLRSIVQLRVKDIKSEDETKEIVLRAYNEGGLALSSLEADELLRLCAEKPLISPEKEPDIVPPLFSLPKPAPRLSLAEMMPEAVQKKENNPSDSFVSPLPTKDTIFSPSGKSIAKPMVQDVVYKEMAVGPIEEIRALTLLDFRRLSKNPEEAAGRLAQKFINLRDESILLFLDAITAWRNSPLYMGYVEILTNALAQRKKITALTSLDSKVIQLPELSALIAMEKKLNI